MPAGLEIFNSSGTSIFQTTSALVKFLGVLQIGADYTGETQSGSVTDSRFTAYTGHVAFFENTAAAFSTDGYNADVTLSGNTLSWSYPDPTPYYAGGFLLNRPNATIIYGIY